MPDPNLRYGLKQIMSNQWFKTKYQPPGGMAKKGFFLGEEDVSIHSNVLLEMEKDSFNKIDTRYVKMCI